MPKSQLHPVRASAIILILFSLGFSIYSFANAWVEPSTTPPGGNVAAPLHTGTTSQTKQGSLSVSGAGGYGIYAQGASYGVYGVNTSTGAYGLLGHGGYGGQFGGQAGHWAGVFSGPVYIGTGGPGADLSISYGGDSEKVSIGSWSVGGIHFYSRCCGFTDPSNGGVIIYPRSGVLSARNYLEVNSWDSQLRQGNGYSRRSIGGAYGWDSNMLYLNGWGDWSSGVSVGGPGGASRLCLNGDCRSGWPATNLGDWYFSGDNFVSNGWGHIYTSSSNLHLDSYSGEMYLNYFYNNWVNVGNRDTGYLFIGNTQLYDDNNWFQIYSGANNRIYTSSYLRVDNNFEVQGNIYCASCGGWISDAFIRWNTWQYGNYYQTNGDIYMGWAGTWLSSALSNKLQLNTWQGNHYSGSDGAEYATIFYDTNNSGYYVDPNGNSRLNYGVFNNVYSVGWMQAPIFYDANDNGYYVDPNGGSRVYQVVPSRINTPSESDHGDNSISAQKFCLGGDCRSSWPSGGTGNCVCFAQHNQYGYGGRNPTCYTYDYMNCGSGWTQIGYKGTNYTYCGGYSGYFPCSPTYP